jgi:undecaprenyl-diphosphatase|tara:strand:- start:554 stop:1351 length:798 start_codon:yes stop_codon:yes gene_type:complete
MISDFLLALFLGFIQGLTEFLPISSSAHLQLPELLLETKNFGLFFDIAVHGGTLAAVIFYFKNDLQELIQAWLPWTSHRDKDQFTLGLNLMIATMPIVFVGLIFSDSIASRDYTVEFIAWTNVIFAVFLLLAFKFSSQSKSLISMTISMAFLIGCLQALAVFPGASRSGMAITGALLIGINLKEGSQFAFLLSIPTIIGALILMLTKQEHVFTLDDLLILSIGFLSSAIIAFLTIKLFLQFVERVGMTPFVLYRLGLGAVLLLLV